MAATASTRGISYWTKLALTLFLAAALLACAGATAYIVLNPVQKDKFTELSILGPDGRAEGYPSAMVVGENKTIFACVENHEDAGTWYDLMVTYSNNTTKKTAYSEHFYLEDNGTWQHPFVIMPDIPDPKVKIGFQVYKNGDMSSPYRECYMWMNVSLPYGYGQTPKE
jgi:Predicted membrane protein